MAKWGEAVDNESGDHKLFCAFAHTVAIKNITIIKRFIFNGYTWGTYFMDRALVSTLRGQKIAAFPCQAAISVDRITMTLNYH